MTNKEIDEALSMSKKYMEYVVLEIQIKYTWIQLWKTLNLGVYSEPRYSTMLSLEEFYKESNLYKNKQL